MMKNLILWLCVSICIISGAVFGDEVFLLNTDYNEESSFNSALHWGDGKAPSAENDYIIEGNRQIRTPGIVGVNYTFAGKSLRLGATNFTSQGDITMRTTTANNNTLGRIYINNLMLYKGQIAPGLEVTTWIGGTATVYSPEESPFLYLLPSTPRVILSAQTLTGAAGTGIEIKGPGAMTVGGLNTAYYGSWLFNNTKVTLNNTYALGAELESVKTDSIKIQNGCTVYFYCGTTVPATRGWQVDAKGVSLVCYSTSIIKGPFTSAGDVTITGGSTFKFANKVSAPNVIINYKTALLNGFELTDDSKMTLKANSLLELAEDADFSIGNLVNEGATLLINANNKQAGSLLITGTYQHTGKLAIALNGPPPTNTTELVVMRIPTSSGVVTKDDFEISQYWYGLGIEDLDVVTQDDMQLVTIKTTQWIQAIDGSPAYLNTPNHWSDGQAVHDGGDYMVKGRDVRQSTADLSVYNFPGKSLSLWSPYCNYLGNFAYVIKQGTFNCEDLRGYDGGGISFGGYYDPQTFKGNLKIHTRDGSNFRFNVGNNRVAIIDAPISGEGTIYYIGQGTYKPWQDNTGYVGITHIHGGYEVGSSVSTLSITNEVNLGANPTTFIADALGIEQRGIFRPEISLTLDDENRGMYMYSSGRIDIPEGVTLTTKIKTSWSGASAKIGSGTWNMCGEAKLVDSSSRLIVSNGTIKVGNAHALTGVQLQFEPDTTLACDVVTDTANELAIYGLLMTRNIEVKADTLKCSVNIGETPKPIIEQPLVTVPRSQVDDLITKLAVDPIKGYDISLYKNDVVYNKQELSTIVAKIEKRSTVIFIR